MVGRQYHRVKPGHRDNEDEGVEVEPDVLWLVLLQPVVVFEEVGGVWHPQPVHIVLRLPPQRHKYKCVSKSGTLS